MSRPPAGPPSPPGGGRGWAGGWGVEAPPPPPVELWALGVLNASPLPSWAGGP